MKICKLWAILFSSLSIASAYSMQNIESTCNVKSWNDVFEKCQKQLTEEVVKSEFNKFNEVEDRFDEEYKDKLNNIFDFIPLVLVQAANNVVMGYDECKKSIESNIAECLKSKDTEELKKMQIILSILSFRLSSVMSGNATENEDISDWIFFEFDGYYNYENGCYRNIWLTDKDISLISQYAQGDGFWLERFFKEKFGQTVGKIQAEYFLDEKKDAMGIIYDFSNPESFKYLKLYIDHMFARLYKVLGTNQSGGKIPNLLKSKYNLKVREEYYNAAKKNHTRYSEVDRELFYMFIQKGLSNHRWKSSAEILNTFSSKPIEYFIEQPGVYEEMFEFSDSDTELRLGYNKMHYIIAMRELNRSLSHCRIKVPVREWRQGMETIFVDYFEKKKFKLKTTKDYNSLFKTIKAANKENIDKVLCCGNVKDYGHFVPFDTEACNPEDGFQIMTILYWALTNREGTHIDTGDYPAIDYNPSSRLQQLDLDLKTVKERVYSFYGQYIIEALEKEVSKQNPRLFGEYFEKVKEDAARRYENDMLFLEEDKARKNAATARKNAATNEVRIAREKERYAKYLANRKKTERSSK